MVFRRSQRTIWSIQVITALSALTFAGVTNEARAQEVNAREKSDCVARPLEDNDKTFSGKLDDCNSVLVPPKVGDGEIVSPTPDAGTMRLIKPGDVPVEKNP